MKKLKKFFLLTFIISWTIWITLVILQDKIETEVVNMVMLIGIFAPNGVAVALKIKEKGLKQFIKGSVKGKVPLWIASILILTTVFLLFGHLINMQMGISFPKTSGLLSPLKIPLILLSTILLATLSEEFGWRGYAQPVLIKKYGVIKGGTILGALWSFWHLPAFFARSLPYQYMPFHQYIITLTILSIFCAMAYEGRGNSILVGAVMHGFLNGLFEILPLMEFKSSGSYLPWVIMNIGLLITLVMTFRRKKKLNIRLG